MYDTLKPGDQVLVASYDRSLHIRHPFTMDIDNANLALDELEGVTGYAQTREMERSEAVAAIYETSSLHKALFEAKAFAENTYNERYVHLIAEANSNRVSFYTIDAAGLRTQSGMGAENQAVNSPTGVSFAVDAVRTSNLQDTLITMADKTGGQAIFNTNDVSEGLQRVTRDFDNYYSLGYRAPVSQRGRYHKIEVRIADKDKSWRIRHREGYRDKPVESQMGDMVAAFFVHGYQTNPLAAAVDMGQQTRLDDGNYDVAIRVRVPIGNITLLPLGEFHQAQVRLYFSAIDEKGSKSPLGEMPLELRIPTESLEVALQDEVGRVINLTMKPGPHKFVVGVRDEISEVRSILGRFVMVGEQK